VIDLAGIWLNFSLCLNCNVIANSATSDTVFHIMSNLIPTTQTVYASYVWIYELCNMYLAEYSLFPLKLSKWYRRCGYYVPGM